MGELNNNIFNNNIAGDTSNILIPDNQQLKKV
ncbi:Hvp 101 VSH-1 tail protein [Brachyspira pilosicoli]|nr:Hvp 101 VSH-1 tail protein [Brachyspira pilosicoli]